MFYQKKLVAVLFAVICFVIPFSGDVRAEDAGPKIAVVDVQMLMSDTKAAKSIQEQVQKGRKALQAEFSEYDKDVLDAQKTLVESKSSDSQEEFNKKRQELEKKIQEDRRAIQQKKRNLEEAVLEATGKLRTEIVKVVAEISDEKGYDIVLTRQNLVIVDKSLDISAEVKSRLEKSLGKIELNVKK